MRVLLLILATTLTLACTSNPPGVEVDGDSKGFLP